MSTYTFEEKDDVIYVSAQTPCGSKIPDIAVILEPRSINPVLRLRDPNTEEYSAGIGLSGLAKILEYMQSRNKELD
jgi:hypothetical protein